MRTRRGSLISTGRLILGGSVGEKTDPSRRACLARGQLRRERKDLLRGVRGRARERPWNRLGAAGRTARRATADRRTDLPDGAALGGGRRRSGWTRRGGFAEEGLLFDGGVSSVGRGVAVRRKRLRQRAATRGRLRKGPRATELTESDIGGVGFEEAGQVSATRGHYRPGYGDNPARAK